jgi:hypothetical protein
MSYDATIAKTIENLSQKSHVISEEAKKAKQDLNKPYSKEISEQKWALLESFSHSIDMLATIFKKSHFDELALLLSNPSRMMILNILIGFMRGIGFAVGVLTVVFILIYSLKTTDILSFLFQIFSTNH